MSRPSIVPSRVRPVAFCQRFTARVVFASQWRSTFIPLGAYPSALRFASSCRMSAPSRRCPARAGATSAGRRRTGAGGVFPSSSYRRAVAPDDRALVGQPGHHPGGAGEDGQLALVAERAVELGGRVHRLSDDLGGLSRACRCRARRRARPRRRSRPGSASPPSAPLVAGERPRGDDERRARRPRRSARLTASPGSPARSRSPARRRAARSRRPPAAAWNSSRARVDARPSPFSPSDDRHAAALELRVGEVDAVLAHALREREHLVRDRGVHRRARVADPARGSRSRHALSAASAFGRAAWGRSGGSPFAVCWLVTGPSPTVPPSVAWPRRRPRRRRRAPHALGERRHRVLGIDRCGGAGEPVGTGVGEARLTTPSSLAAGPAPHGGRAARAARAVRGRREGPRHRRRARGWWT